MKALTFDNEEHYHLLEPRPEVNVDFTYAIIEPMTRRIVTALANRGVKALLFVVGEVAEKYPQLITDICSEGHVFGSHSMSHRLHSKLSDEEFVMDLRESIAAITNASGQKVKTYRAPGLSLTSEFMHRLELLHAEGIEFDISLFIGEASHGRGTAKWSPKTYGSSIMPCSYKNVATYPFLSSRILGLKAPLLGGGCFRLATYNKINLALKRHRSAMTYFHPRDFDPSQPMTGGLSFFRKFKSYLGLRSNWKKFQRRLDENDWTHPITFIS